MADDVDVPRSGPQERPGSGEQSQRRRAIYTVSGFYLVFYAAAAALVPNLPLIFEDAGLSGSQIGFLLALPPAVGILAAPTYALIADLTGRGRFLLMSAIALCGLSAIALSAVSAFLAALAVMLVFAVAIAPIVPFTDAAAVEVATERRNYGTLRRWGGVGWGAAAVVVGIGVDQVGLGLAFAAFATGMAVLLVLSRRLPLAIERAGGLRDVRSALASSRGWLGLLSGAFVVGVAGGVIGFLFVVLRDLGASSTVMGMALAIATASELIGFSVADRVIARLGVAGTLILGCLAAAVRLLMYGFAPSIEIALAAQALHGVTFAIPWVAGVTAAARLSPTGLGTTGQGIFSAVGLGLGPTVGVVVAGILIDAGSTASMMTQMSAILLPLTLVVSIPLLRSFPRTSPST